MLQKNWFKNCIKGSLVFILFWYSFLFQYIPVILFKLDLKHLSGSMHVILSVFSSLIVLFILLLVYKKDLKREFKKFKNNFLENMDMGLKYYLIGLSLMMISNLIITLVFKGSGAANEETVQTMIKHLPWLMVINAGIIAPINEEIIFRKTIKDVFKSKWIFVFLSFLLFGGAHVIGNNATSLIDYMYIFPYGVLGACFALAYYKTNTVFTSITFHMIHNTVLTLLSIYII